MTISGGSTRGGVDPLWLAWGHGGQFLLVAPARDLVVVATTAWPGMGATASQWERTVLTLLVNQVVPAARSGEATSDAPKRRLSDTHRRYRVVSSAIRSADQDNSAPSRAAVASIAASPWSGVS